MIFSLHNPGSNESERCTPLWRKLGANTIIGTDWRLTDKTIFTFFFTMIHQT
jgi:hypothetical protein